MDETVYYSSRRGVAVTSRYLRTRYKDQALAPITSIRVGRDPLLVGLGMGTGLLLFAWSSSDILYVHEQWLIGLLASGIIIVGYCVASLELGTLAHRRTMLWGNIRTVLQVRAAIVEARRHLADGTAEVTAIESSDQ